MKHVLAPRCRPWKMSMTTPEASSRNNVGEASSAV
jgi:hypothetical protein